MQLGQKFIDNLISQNNYRVYKVVSTDDTKSYMLKVIKVDGKQQLFYEHEIKKRVDYLIRKKQYQSIIQITKQQFVYAKQKSNDQKLIVIQRQFYLFKTLKQQFLNQFQAIRQIDIATYTRQLFDIFLRAQGIQDQIITIDNIFLHRIRNRQKMVLNITSLTGYNHIYSKDLTIRQFQQTYKIMDISFYDRPPQKRINHIVHIRAFLNILLFLITGFDAKLYTSQNQLKQDKMQKIGVMKIKDLLALSASKFELFFNFESVKKRIQQVSLKYKIQYMRLFKEVFVKGTIISWPEMKRILINHCSFDVRGENKQQIEDFHLRQIQKDTWNIFKNLWANEKYQAKLFYKQNKLIDDDEKDYDLYLMVKTNIDLSILLQYSKFSQFLQAKQNQNQSINNFKLFSKFTILFSGSSKESSIKIEQKSEQKEKDINFLINFAESKLSQNYTENDNKIVISSNQENILKLYKKLIKDRQS